MGILRKVDPDGVLLLFLFGLVGSIYAYDRLSGERAPDGLRFDPQGIALHRIVDSQKQCLPAANGADRRKEKTES